MKLAQLEKELEGLVKGGKVVKRFRLCGANAGDTLEVGERIAIRKGLYIWVGEKDESLSVKEVLAIRH